MTFDEKSVVFLLLSHISRVDIVNCYGTDSELDYTKVEERYI